MNEVVPCTIVPSIRTPNTGCIKGCQSASHGSRRTSFLDTKCGTRATPSHTNSPTTRKKFQSSTVSTTDLTENKAEDEELGDCFSDFLLARILSRSSSSIVSGEGGLGGAAGVGWDLVSDEGERGFFPGGGGFFICTRHVDLGFTRRNCGSVGREKIETKAMGNRMVESNNKALQSAYTGGEIDKILR